MALLSPIGRRVDNWWDYDKDLILKILYDDYFNPFNTNNLPTNLDYLVERIGFDYKRVEMICLRLKEEGLIDEISKTPYEKFFKITPKGVEFVEQFKSLYD